MSDIVGMSWDDWLAYLKPRWRPGQHMALCGPTEAAKTTAACSMLLSARRWVGAFDAKGGDDVMEAAGFRRVPKWDRNTTRRILAEIAPTEDNPRGRPAHLQIGPKIETRADRPKLLACLEAALAAMYDMGKWTLYFDDLQLMYDRRMAALATMIDEFLISARQPKKLTVISSFQAPSYVSPRASDQAWWFGVFRTRDTEVVARLGEMAGRSRAEMRGIVAAMPAYHIAWFSRNLDDPIILTRTRPIRPAASTRRPALSVPAPISGWRRAIWGDMSQRAA